MGSLLLLVAGFGWAKPVPINPYVLERRSPAAVMWVSLAGPFSNFLMAILAAIPFRLGLVSVANGFAPSAGFLPSFDKVMVWFIYINLLLALFNLIPLAPLDGEKIATYFLPPSIGRYFEIIRPYGPMILLLLVCWQDRFSALMCSGKLSDPRSNSCSACWSDEDIDAHTIPGSPVLACPDRHASAGRPGPGSPGAFTRADGIIPEAAAQ